MEDSELATTKDRLEGSEACSPSESSWEERTSRLQQASAWEEDSQVSGVTVGEVFSVSAFSTDPGRQWRRTRLQTLQQSEPFLSRQSVGQTGRVVSTSLDSPGAFHLLEHLQTRRLLHDDHYSEPSSISIYHLLHDDHYSEPSSISIYHVLKQRGGWIDVDVFTSDHGFYADEPRRVNFVSGKQLVETGYDLKDMDCSAARAVCINGHEVIKVFGTIELVYKTFPAGNEERSSFQVVKDMDSKAFFELTKEWTYVELPG